jgi:hypothetical protein
MMILPKIVNRSICFAKSTHEEAKILVHRERQTERDRETERFQFIAGV